jgi:hypothetical protein
MKKINKISGLFLSVSALSCIFWIGSYLLRMFLTYQLFNETMTAYRPFINDKNINAILLVLNPSVITTLVLYVIFILSFILFLFTTKLNLKQNGWLFIITVLVFITAPFEIYLMTIDYKIFNMVYSGIFTNGDVLNLITKRFKDLSSFALIELLCYCTVILLAIFQPLTRNSVKNEN